MKNKKYLLMPGYITSENDGDKHYISPVQLKNLYNVPMSECLIYSNRINKYPEDIIILKPKHDGSYKNYGEQDEGNISN